MRIECRRMVGEKVIFVFFAVYQISLKGSRASRIAYQEAIARILYIDFARTVVALARKSSSFFELYRNISHQVNFSRRYRIFVDISR